MYRWFSDDEQISCHLPYTQIYKPKADVADMMKNKRKNIYKTVFGLRGHRIMQAGIEDGHYVFRFREMTPI
jgi:hypothetical protein